MFKQPLEKKKTIVLGLAPHFVFLGGNDLEIGKKLVLRLYLIFSGGNDLEIVLCKVPSL